MDVNINYTLELFPTSIENWNAYVSWFGKTEIDRNNNNAGVDLYCVQQQHVSSDRVTLLDLGVKARMVRNDTNEIVHFWLAPRSSIWKSDVRQANSMGVIDRSYRGVLMGAVIANDTGKNVVIDYRTRLFQVLAPDMGWIKKVIIMPLSELDETSRGEGGFGSTGL